MEIELALFLSPGCFFSAGSVNILGIPLQALTKFAAVYLKLTGDLPPSHPTPRKSRTQQEPPQKLTLPSNTADVNPATLVMTAQPPPAYSNNGRERLVMTSLRDIVCPRPLQQPLAITIEQVSARLCFGD